MREPQDPLNDVEPKSEILTVPVNNVWQGISYWNTNQDYSWRNAIENSPLEVRRSSIVKVIRLGALPKVRIIYEWNGVVNFFDVSREFQENEIGWGSLENFSYLKLLSPKLFLNPLMAYLTIFFLFAKFFLPWIATGTITSAAQARAVLSFFSAVLTVSFPFIYAYAMKPFIRRFLKSETNKLSDPLMYLFVLYAGFVSLFAP